MKKILATILALVMVFSLSVTAMAADPDTIESVTANNVSTGTVEVTVTEGVNDKIVYSVTVEWKEMDMEYQTQGEGTWNPATHTYDNPTVEKWLDNTAEVTVTNHSNAGVTATIAEGTKETTGITYSFSVEGSTANSFDLATAEDTLTTEAPNNSFTITASGTPTEGDDTFTVTIAKPYWNELPINLYEYYTDEDSTVSAEVSNRGRFDIGTASAFTLGLNEDDTTAYEITDLEVKAVGPYQVTWDWDADGSVTNNYTYEATYNVKITVTDSKTNDAKYAYLLIKQDAAPAEPETIELTVSGTLADKGSSVIVTLPEGYTLDNVSYAVTSGATASAGDENNQIVVTHTGICMGGESYTLTVTSNADPNVTGTITIQCNV